MQNAERTQDTSSQSRSDNVLSLKTGIDSALRAQIAEQLNATVASTSVLAHKTQAVHWNAEGPLFYSLHNLTESQYKDMSAAVDALAERVRALGFPAITSLHALREASVIEDEPLPAALDAREMTRHLVEDHVKLAAELRRLINKAEEAQDHATADLLTERMNEHEAASWMLGSLIR